MYNAPNALVFFYFLLLFRFWYMYSAYWTFSILTFFSPLDAIP